MPMNIQINKENLEHLAQQDLGDIRLTPMQVSLLETDLNNRPLTEEEEVAYLFLTPQGNIVFRFINGEYQVSSATGENKLFLFKKFSQLAEKFDVNYTSIGYEPF